ncbi:MAG: pirin family protein [Cytophagaceae bacterium]|nr:pirin family protein [Cytophagaceae bacterium]
MATTVLHTADSRGTADHGWLQSFHSFSFAHYYNPDRIHFGALRVLNDDTVQGGNGFGKHPHDNMEIISIPLEGDLEHKDSMGNTTVISAGDIQVMSAGTGVFHSEFNKNPDQAVKFLQIWIFPNVKNVTPRYDQQSLQLKDRENVWQQILSPSPNDAGVWIHQDAWFHIGRFDAHQSSTYTLKKQGNGVYVFVLQGSWSIEQTELNTRDAIAITDASTIHLTALSPQAEALIIEVPLTW